MKKNLLFALGLFLLVTSLFSQTFTCGDTLVDVRDGKKYTTVLIGTQCWMKENLNYGKTVKSFSSTVTHSDMFNNSISEKYAPNGDSTKLPAYGGLYEWDELMNYSTVAGGQGLCPANWHVPTDAEWQTMIAAAGGTLITSAGGYGGNKLKAIGEGFGSGIGTNTSGFSAKAAGDRDSYGIFYGLTLRSIFWTSTQNTAASAYQFTLWAENDTIAHGGNAQKMTGFSCRCVRNIGAGVEEISLKNQLSVYPNPATDLLTFKSILPNDELTLKVFNVIGELVCEKNFIEAQTINTSDWRKGIYFYKAINSKSQTATGKLIIQ